MCAKRLLWVGVICLSLTGMRDPFQPPLDTCQITQLSGWHFHGLVESVRQIGILRDASGRWRRVTLGERLSTGWRITAISQHELQIATGEGCHPAQWRWKRKGIQDEKMDHRRRVFYRAVCFCPRG